MRKIALLSSLIFLFVIVMGYIVVHISYKNQEIELSESIHSKIKDNKTHYTKMWEILTQKAGVSKEYSKQFKEIYPELIKGRYSNGNGQLMQWIQEHNPTFDSSLYKDVMNSIEAQRESFQVTQEQLIDLSRQHNVLLKRFPSNWFLSHVDPIEIPIITNEASDKAFESGKEEKMILY